MIGTLSLMASPRFYADTATGSACYHCVSRVVGRQRVLDDEAKDEFVRLMRAYETFCQVRILSYVVMTDHFHVLVEVKSRPVGAEAREFTDEWLIKQLRLIYAKPYVDDLAKQLAELRSQSRKGGRQADELKEKYLGRMWDVSQFMKELKQRFSLWFNKRNGRRGTLWEERFASVLVEDKAQALSVLSAYLDLNPVRAGLVNHPADYTWCNYAEAGLGNRKALSALAKVTGLQAADGGSRLPPAAKILQAYDPLLVPGEPVPSAGQAKKRALDQSKKAAKAPAAEGGEDSPKRRGRQPQPKLSLQEGLRHQVRYFSRGVVVGSEAFVEEFFQSHRDRFQPDRKSGARPMKEADFGDLKSMRALRTGVVRGDQ